MRLAAREHVLLDELKLLPDAHERLAAVVDRARGKARFSNEERTPAHRVPGCSSSVWLIAEWREGRCHFRSDADSPVVRGLVGLLTDFFTDATAAEIADSSADPLQLLDLNRMLSPTRRLGIGAVRAAIHNFASIHLAAHEMEGAR